MFDCISFSVLSPKLMTEVEISYSFNFLYNANSLSRIPSLLHCWRDPPRVRKRTRFIFYFSTISKFHPSYFYNLLYQYLILTTRSIMFLLYTQYSVYYPISIQYLILFSMGLSNLCQTLEL